MENPLTCKSISIAICKLSNVFMIMNLRGIAELLRLNELASELVRIYSLCEAVRLRPIASLGLRILLTRCWPRGQVVCLVIVSFPLVAHIGIALDVTTDQRDIPCARSNRRLGTNRPLPRCLRDRQNLLNNETHTPSSMRINVLSTLKWAGQRGRLYGHC